MQQPIMLSISFDYFLIIISKEIINYKVNELHPIFIKFLAVGLLQDIVSNILKKAYGGRLDKERM